MIYYQQGGYWWREATSEFIVSETPFVIYGFVN